MFQEGEDEDKEYAYTISHNNHNWWGHLLASELDLYNTTRVKSPRKQQKGIYDVIDIRGSHTLEEIEKYY